jgi:hypothetical protein
VSHIDISGRHTFDILRNLQNEDKVGGPRPMGILASHCTGSSVPAREGMEEATHEPEQYDKTLCHANRSPQESADCG